MSKYALRRILAGIPILLGGATAIFLIINLIPGDPAAMMLGEYYSDASYEAVRRRLGLDQPLYIRYLHFMGSSPNFSVKCLPVRFIVSQSVGARCPTADHAVSGAKPSIRSC